MNYAVYVDRRSADGCFDLAGIFFDCDNVELPGPEHLAHEFAAMVEFDYGARTFIVQKDGRTDFPGRKHPTHLELALCAEDWRADRITAACEWCRKQADEARALRAVR